MPMIPIPPTPALKEAITVRLEHTLHDQLKQYAEFIHGPKDYVIGQALRHLFRKDKEFATWAAARPSTDAPLSSTVRKRTVEDHSDTSVTACGSSSPQTRSVGGV